MSQPVETVEIIIPTPTTNKTHTQKQNAAERYQLNREYFKTLNLLHYHRKQNHEQQINELTEKLESLHYTPTPPQRQRRPLTSAQLFPEYTKLTTKRVRLINRIRSKQANNTDINADIQQLRSVVEAINNIPSNQKPQPNLSTAKAKNNAALIEELIKSR